MGGAPGDRALPKKTKPAKNPDSVYDLISFDGRKNYDVRDLLATIVDENSLDEYKADYGKTLVTAYARINGQPTRASQDEKGRNPDGRRHLFRKRRQSGAVCDGL
jgi:hypothetical protein